MSGVTLTYTGELVVVTCWCGTAHAVPKGLRDHQLSEHRDGRKFDVFCPLGHSYIVSGKSKWREEQERADAAEARLLATRDQLAAERKAHTATKANLTKTKKRVAGGVCPCCNRSFVQLTRHMATKHPGYGGTA